MHLSDFVDYSLPEFKDQMPVRNRGSYIPQALTTSLEDKLYVFRRMIDLIARDYTFITLKDWMPQVNK
jgi:hypothetical protein